MRVQCSRMHARTRITHTHAHLRTSTHSKVPLADTSLYDWIEGLDDSSVDVWSVQAHYLGPLNPACKR